jgi:hypothetical protein
LTLLILVTTSLGGIIIELFCQVIKLFWGNDFIPETDEAKHIMGQAKAMVMLIFT